MTRVTKATCISALAVLGVGVTGIVNSYDIDDLPASLNTAQLPCLFHMDAGTDSLDMSAQRGTVGEAHHIRVICIVEPVGQSRLEDNLGRAITLYDAYFTALMTNANRATTNWADCTIVKTAPLGVMPYAKIEYHAFDILVDLTVYTKV